MWNTSFQVVKKRKGQLKAVKQKTKILLINFRHYPVQSYRDDDGDYGNQSYGYNYRNYRMPNETGIKGKIEQKYWRSKQKVIEKLGKDQDEHVIAGDAEVDARLEVQSLLQFFFCFEGFLTLIVFLVFYEPVVLS